MRRPGEAEKKESGRCIGGRASENAPEAEGEGHEQQSSSEPEGLLLPEGLGEGIEAGGGDMPELVEPPYERPQHADKGHDRRGARRPEARA